MSNLDEMRKKVANDSDDVIEKLKKLYVAYGGDPDKLDEAQQNSLIRPDIEDQLLGQFVRRGPLHSLFPMHHRRRTRRERLRSRLFVLRWRLHDLLFPDCRNNEGNDW